jgi:predicted PurR-regulated permease PerM
MREEPVESNVLEPGDSQGHRPVIAQPINWRSASITGLFLLALFYTLHLGRTLFLPVVLAVLLSLILKPVVRTLKLLGIQEGMGAAIILFTMIGFLIIGVNTLSEPAGRWVAAAPESLRVAETKFRLLLKPFIQLNRAAREVEKLASVTEEEKPRSAETSPGPRESRTVKDPPPAAVAVGRATLTDVFLGYTKSFIVGAVEMFVLLFFLLAAGDLFLLKWIRVLPRLKDQKQAVEIAREVERQVSTYLLTTTVINFIEGTLVATAMYFCGMPNPVLWGVVAGLLNFSPYLGFWLAETVITLVAFMTFDTLGEAVLPPMLYLAINFVEGNFISPMILGRRLTLNPVVIFLSLMFWGWMWGIPGALVAVPLLMALKILCDHVEGLAPIGEFLSS